MRSNMTMSYIQRKAQSHQQLKTMHKVVLEIFWSLPLFNILNRGLKKWLGENVAKYFLVCWIRDIENFIVDNKAIITLGAQKSWAIIKSCGMNWFTNMGDYDVKFRKIRFE